MSDNNSHIIKSLLTYNNNYNKFLTRKKNKQDKLITVIAAHAQIKTPMIK